MLRRRDLEGVRSSYEGEQREEEQDKMPGKEGSLRRVRKCFRKIRGGQEAEEKELTLCDGSHAGHMESFSF